VLEKARTSPRLTDSPVGIHPALPGTSIPVAAPPDGTLPLVPEGWVLMMSWLGCRCPERISKVVLC
jgi:hypothetical protein